MRGGSNSRRADRPNLFYPVFVDPTDKTIKQIGEPLPLEQSPQSVATPDGLVAVWPVRANGAEANWRVSPDYLRELLNLGYARVGSYDKKNDRWSLGYLGKAQIRRIEQESIVIVGRRDDGSVLLEAAEQSTKRMPKTVWNRPSHKAGEYGSALVKKLTMRGFPFPKSLYAVEDTLRTVIADKPDALVLDFFSGSGTTAHAVMRLNKQDGGHRRSISVTNNEVSVDEHKALIKKGLRPGDAGWESLGICDYITKPRIAAAITGRTPDGAPIKGDYKFTDEFPMADGFEENVEFLTLTYLNPTVVGLNLAFSSVAPLLWMRAGSQGRRIEERTDTFDVADTYAVLFDVDASGAFLKVLDDVEDLRVAYIVTDDETQFQAVASQLPKGVEAVRLYETYLRTFEINTGRA